mmetsp:Transcript_12516/g.18404  ORF Transcript_12516/g.18404 Transcript_12516/m.18404 type:complete len:95 (+) Transcript_12516:522-806(+)
MGRKDAKLKLRLSNSGSETVKNVSFVPASAILLAEGDLILSRTRYPSRDYGQERDQLLEEMTGVVAKEEILRGGASTKRRSCSRADRCIILVRV